MCLEAIGGLRNHQIQYLLVRFCAGSVKFCHAIRNTPPENIPDSIKSMDILLAESLRKCLGGLNAGLPVKLGVLCLPRISNMALPVYLGSLAQSCEIQASIPQDLHPAILSRLTPFVSPYNNPPCQFLHTLPVPILNTNYLC